jgi:peptidoglycan/LPS O-acetylase OafA/YrhL
MYYLVLPLAALWFRPRRWIAVMLLALATMLVYRGWVDSTFGAAPIGERVNLLAQLPARIDQFVLGSLAAYALIQTGLRAAWRLRDEAIAVGVLLAIAALALWLRREVDAYWHGAPIQYLWHGLFALAVASLCVLAVRGSRVVDALFDNRALAFFGRIRFSLYLWHFPLLQWVAGAAWVQALPGSAALHLFVLGVPLAIAVAWLSWRCVERPFLRLAHRANRPGSVAPGAS